MAKIKFHDSQTELLFIVGSTGDTRGRVVVSDYSIEVKKWVMI